MNYVLRAMGNYDVDAASKVAGLVCPVAEDMTQQQFKEECDINTIVRNFGLTGSLPDDYRQPVSGDFSDVPSYEEARLAVRQAEEQFMKIPAETRYRFNNDPQRLIDFLEDGANRDEALKLGLIKPRPEVTRDVVQAVDELREVMKPKV